MKLTKFEVDKLSTAEANAIKAGSGWTFSGATKCYGANYDYFTYGTESDG